MPEAAPEIEQLLHDTVEAMVQGDLEKIERQMSKDACLVGIGTAPEEWTESHDALMQLFRESTPDGPSGVTARLDQVRAFREGNVGWAAAQGAFELDGGTRIPVRMTVVMVQEDGSWATVQTHASIGVPNDRMSDPMFQG